jgi:hypothetical protein
VTGLFLLATAVPHAIAWAAGQVVRHSMGASVVDSRMTDAFDQRAVETGAEIVARVLVGAALLALSRRPNFWPISDEAAEADRDPDAPAADA